MIIINKEMTSIVNFEQVENIFVGAGGTSIKANLKSGNGMQLGFYGSVEEAKIVIQILAEQISKNIDCIKMPQDKQIEAKINSVPYSKPHHINGKKQKGFGGS